MRRNACAFAVALCAMVAAGAKADVLTAGFAMPISNIDIDFSPDGVVDHSSSLVLGQIYDGLVNLDENLQVTPELASSWTISIDQTVYTFHINRSLQYLPQRFISGAAIKHYYEWMLRQHPDRQWIFDGVVGINNYLQRKSDDIQGISADQDMIVFTFERPSRTFLFRLASTLAKIGFRDGDRGPFSGTGPYRYESQSAEDILLTRNELNPRGRNAMIPRVRFRLFATNDAANTAFRRGELSLLQAERLEDMQRFKAEGYRISEFPNYAVDIFVLNYRSLPRSLRRYIANATNISSDIERLGLVGAAETKSLVPADLRGWTQLKIPVGRMASAGISPTERSVRLLISNRYYDNVRSMLDDLRRQWSAAMPRVQYDVVPHAEYIRRLYRREYDIAYVRYMGDYPDPDAYYYPFLHTGGQFNFMGYSDPRVDELMDLARQMISDRDSDLIFDRINGILAEDPVVIPLLTTRIAIVTQPTISSIRVNGQGIWCIGVSKINLAGWEGM